ncbi:MAG: hypothetical protein NZ700_02570 [Gemmataceae bacterium]|nr:hypothetical protein [Gemmataceae bacterium]MDW8265256.1 hypothetical protein [Gemmataceae bacterium]
MPTITLEQALYGNTDRGGYRFLACSPGFRDDWRPLAERLCAGFGERPPGVACPAAVFAASLGKSHVAVVQVADRGWDDAGRPGALGFHILVLSRADYQRLSGDPFLIADRFPPPWSARDSLPSLSWTDELPGQRPVEELQRILQRSEGPSLLGGTQALIDGSRLVFVRSGPDTPLVRDLWQLLPTSTRSELRPASFAFGPALGFDVLVVPRADGPDYVEYMTEEQAADYPEGRYELNLQVAIEAGSQAEVDALVNRRSSAQTLRLAAGLVVGMAVVAGVLRWDPGGRPAAEPPPATGPDLPPVAAYRPLSEQERHDLTEALHQLAAALKIEPLPEPATPTALLAAIDQRLGTPPGRDPGPLYGPVERQLRTVLWKQGVAEYADPRLNCVELVERLERRVVRPAREPHEH